MYMLTFFKKNKRKNGKVSQQLLNMGVRVGREELGDRSGRKACGHLLDLTELISGPYTCFTELK